MKPTVTTKFVSVSVFASCIIKSSTTHSYWALFLGRWSPFSFILCKSLLHHVVEHCLPLPGLSRNGISLTSSFSASHSRTTTLKERRISSWGHDGGPVSSWRARPARSVLDFNLCFQLSCLFLFCFCFAYFLPSSSLFLFLFLFSIFLSVACLSASSLFLLGTQTWHLARYITHRKLYSSLSFLLL